MRSIRAAWGPATPGPGSCLFDSAYPTSGRVRRPAVKGGDAMT